jgi:hypothetical protein
MRILVQESETETILFSNFFEVMTLDGTYMQKFCTYMCVYMYTCMYLCISMKQRVLACCLKSEARCSFCFTYACQYETTSAERQPTSFNGNQRMSTAFNVCQRQPTSVNVYIYRVYISVSQCVICLLEQGRATWRETTSIACGDFFSVWTRKINHLRQRRRKRKEFGPDSEVGNIQDWRCGMYRYSSSDLSRRRRSNRLTITIGVAQGSSLRLDMPEAL